MIITIHRARTNPVTVGMMDIDGQLFGVTLERPWKNNAHNISCIPPGTYSVAFTPSPKFNRDMLEVLNVPGRNGIRIHAANYAHELEGCISVAAKLMGDNAISGTIVPKLEAKIRDAVKGGESVTMKILDPNPPVT
jgi:hypothetical protein